jgi:RHS repeat-associated protein
MDNYENPEKWRDVGPHYNQNGAATNITVRYNGMNLTGTFNWDYDGNLTSYSGEHQTNLWFTMPPPPKTLSWKYDALGGRIARTGTIGDERIHVLDQAAALKNVLVQKTDAGTIDRWYIYAPGFGLVAHIDGDGTVRYYHGDHLGSTIALTDANGNLTDEFAYTPYGELMAHTGTTETPYTFCGRHGAYYEGGALYHMKHRYYRADLARFISSDPIGISGGLNLYAYANGNPIIFLDALGLCGNDALWFDRVGSWAADASESLQQTMTETYPWQIAGTLNTVIQLGQGFISTPQSIGHLGEGTGTFAGNPTLENSAGMFSDISLTAGILAAGMSDLPSANRPIGSGSQMTPPASSPTGNSSVQMRNGTQQPRLNSPGSVGNQNYTGHAFDQMQNRGIVPSVVENTIRVGESFSTRAGTSGYYDAANQIRVIVNSESGSVITVIPGSL